MIAPDFPLEPAPRKDLSSTTPRPTFLEQIACAILTPIMPPPTIRMSHVCMFQTWLSAPAKELYPRRTGDMNDCSRTLQRAERPYRHAVGPRLKEAPFQSRRRELIAHAMAGGRELCYGMSLVGLMDTT